MARKHTPDEPSATSEADAATATTELPLPQSAESTRSFVGRLEPRKPVPDPFCLAFDNVAGVRLYENRQDRVMAIEFDEKPGQAVLDTLKSTGYRWNPKEKVWTHPVRADSASTTRVEAKRLYNELRGMIRQEKGVESAPEIPF